MLHASGAIASLPCQPHFISTILGLLEKEARGRHGACRPQQMHCHAKLLKETRGRAQVFPIDFTHLVQASGGFWDLLLGRPGAH